MVKSLTIRPSTVASMMLCPARQILKDEDESYFPSEPLVFGSLVHWRIEQHLLSVAGFNFDQIAEELRDIYRRDAGESAELTHVTSKRKIRELVNEAMVAYEMWVESVLPQLPDEEPLVERQVSAQIWVSDDYDIELSGTPDVVYPEIGLVVDWKTAGRNWNADKVQSQVQPWAYSLMLLYNGFTIKRFDFWVYDRSTESWWCHTHWLEDYAIAHAALIRQASMFAIQKELSIPTYSPSGSGWKARGWHCSPQYCDQWEDCGGKYLVNDGQAELPALNAKTKGWT